MGGKADAGRRVDNQADVSRVGQRRPAGVQADSHEHHQAVRPRARPHLPLDGDRRVDGGARLFENGKHLVRSRIHFAAARRSNGVTEDAPNVGQQRAVAVAKARDQPGRVGDVGKEKGDGAGRERAHLTGASADLASHPFVLNRQLLRCGALRAKLAGHEPDRHDAVLFGGFEQPRPRAIPGGLVLEGRLIEASQSVADMRLVIDRQPPLASGVDVGKGTVRQSVARFLAELRHGAP